MKITIADGRGALWQWDTGRRLRVGSGVEQIHYQNKCFGRSVDVDVGDDGTAIIPDELLQDWHPLTAYAYVTDDTGAYTMVQQDFIVHKRAKPAGYTYTPTDQMTLRTIQRQIGDLADLTTEAKDTLVAAINEVARTGGAGSMDLRVSDGYIQYSTDGGSTWTNLIAVADLKGADGKPGLLVRTALRRTSVTMAIGTLAAPIQASHRAEQPEHRAKTAPMANRGLLVRTALRRTSVTMAIGTLAAPIQASHRAEQPERRAKTARMANREQPVQTASRHTSEIMATGTLEMMTPASRREVNKGRARRYSTSTLLENTPATPAQWRWPTSRRRMRRGRS